MKKTYEGSGAEALTDGATAAANFTDPFAGSTPRVGIWVSVSTVYTYNRGYSM